MSRDLTDSSFASAEARTVDGLAEIRERNIERTGDLRDGRPGRVGLPPFRLLDSQTVAGMLGVSEDWVREHAAELGAIRIGDGPKGALRFDTARVRAALERRRVDRPPERRRRQSAGRRRSLSVVPTAVPADVKDW